MSYIKRALPLIILLLISWYTHVFTMMHQRPQSVHMWAMCDRGSVARNYAQESMNFFEPRVHETKGGEGICGMEFPLMNYLAAICYKIFGFNEFWYRFLMFVVYASGMLAAYQITSYFLNNTLYRCLVVSIFACSPVLTYYSANFIPDTASLGFTFLAWSSFFKWKKYSSPRYFVAFFIFILLASLIKITALIGVIILLGIWTFSKLFSKNKLSYEKVNSALLVSSLILVVVLALSWIQYAKFLNEKYGLSVFLMQARPPENWNSIRETIYHVNDIWVNFYFYKPFYLIILLSILSIVFFFKKISQELLFITMGYFVGVLGFVYLMLLQFTNHDYYIITLVPVLFFILLSAFQILEKSNLNIKVTGTISVAFFVLIVFGIQYNRKHQEFRMDKHCWLNDWARFEDYQEVEPYVQSLKINKNETAMAICDYSPNIALYFLNLKGWSVADLSDDQTFKDILQKHPHYVVMDDSLQSKRPIFKEFPIKLIGQYKRISIYKTEY